MKSNMTKQKTRTEELSPAAIWLRKQRAARLANGLCMYCDRKQEPGRNYCRYHHNSRNKKYTRPPPSPGSVGERRRLRLKVVALMASMSLCDLKPISAKELGQQLGCSQFLK